MGVWHNDFVPLEITLNAKVSDDIAQEVVKIPDLSFSLIGIKNIVLAVLFTYLGYITTILYPPPKFIVDLIKGASNRKKGRSQSGESSVDKK